MSSDGATLREVIKARSGHFQLESGHHGSLWLDLDSLFVRPRAVEPYLRRLALLIARHDVEAVCGPLTGGAFAAHWIASELGLLFLYSAPSPTATPPTALYPRAYTIPDSLAREGVGRRLAVVDDVINAGSATRATADALRATGAQVTVVGALVGLGDVGTSLLRREGSALEVVESWTNSIWAPTLCPLCSDGAPLERP